MPLEGSFILWNNRGGTGKTTFAYHLANKYALKHPDKTVLLIDMCPQADLSHAFLGDDQFGLDYVSQLGTLRKDPMTIGNQRIPKTISGYLDLCTMQGMLLNNVDPRTFLINVSKLNPQLARNLYLLCGDPSIELVAKSLEQKRNQHSTLSQFGQFAWKSITTCIKQFIAKIAERKGIKLVAFIDVNSAFSILTEIALAAAEKLIIPITDDHLHRNGFEYMFALLYGFSQPSNAYYYYRHLSFYYRANEYDVKLPKIHLILNKVSNQNESLKTNTNNDSDWEFIFDLYKKHPQAFNVRNNSNDKQEPSQTLTDFKNQFVVDIYETYSTNQSMRQAVRSHSPLLSVKNSFKSYSNRLNSSINNLSMASIGSLTPKIARSTSPPTSNRESVSKKHVSYENTNGISSTPAAAAVNRPYPFQHQQHITKPNLVKKRNDSNKQKSIVAVEDDSLALNSLSAFTGDDNIVLFDKILDKIIDTLTI